MALTSVLGAPPSELANIILGAVGGTPLTTISTGVQVGTSFAPNASIAASFSTVVQVGTQLRVQPVFSTRVLVGHNWLVNSDYVSMKSPVNVASKFVAYAGALASGRWRH